MILARKTEGRLKMEWLKRMNLVLDYIEDNLDGEIDDNKIAMLSTSSKGMFQRFFALITDMTLSEYIRKRRLTQAALDIINTDAKIIDIAIKYGYDSATAFGSAFKIFHGMTPSKTRMSHAQYQSFHRFSFKLTISIKGGNNMQYRIIEAEDILQKIADTAQGWGNEFLGEIKERNGVKFACDGNRAGVILPEGIGDWDFAEAYFETGDKDNPKVDLNNAFSNRTEDICFNFQISKEKAAGLLGVLNYFDDLKEDSSAKVMIGLNVNTMEIIKSETAVKLMDKPGERIIAFNLQYFKEALDFIMCSDDENIEIYYTGSTQSFIMKSSRFYAAVLPVRIKNNETD
jgi:AraC-like DNA-binding protein